MQPGSRVNRRAIPHLPSLSATTRFRHGPGCGIMGLKETALEQTEHLTLADAIFPAIGKDSRAVSIGRDVALMVGFAAFVALFAQFQVRLPWTPVPVTGQTFAVLVAGGALGALRGAGSLTIYGLMGTLGLPVFTPSNAATSGT